MKKKTLKNTIVAFTVAGIIIFGATTSEAALGDRPLYQGVNHADVKELQQNLRSLNFFNHGSNTTYYGNVTKQAVVKFQKANGLSADGSFGPASYRALKGKTSNNNTNSKPSQPSKVNTTTQSLGNRPLRSGAKGADVKVLQNALAKLGHYKSAIDSSFGPATRSAVLSFQRAQNIQVDGSAGPLTIKTLNKVLKGKVSAGKPSNSPSRGEGKKNIGINVTNTAKKYIGYRYSYGGTSPSGFDCSGFTQYVYKQMGINVPRTTGSQASVGTRVSKSQLQAGDLIVFKNTSKQGVSHVGVYIGGGQFVHASTPKSGVKVDSIHSNYYVNRFHSGRRLF